MRKTSIGGQAVMEGVMIMGREKACMAVRRKDGSISTVERDRSLFPKQHPWAKLPIIRGCVNLVLQMKIGYGMLMKSAAYIEQDELADEGEEANTNADAQQNNKSNITEGKAAGTDDTEQHAGSPDGNSEEAGGNSWIVYIGVILGVVFAIGLFFVLPSLITGFFLERTSPFVSLFEGVIRIGILVIYMWACSLMKEMRRVFQYHGAEHKVIHCYEHELDPTPENAARFSTVHPSCGTSYIFLVMIVSIVVFAFIGKGMGPAMRIVLRIGLLPFVAGLSYEVLKFAAKYDNILTKIIRAPGLLLQKITTKQPDDDMLEVAAKAFYMAAEADGEA